MRDTSGWMFNMRAKLSSAKWKLEKTKHPDRLGKREWKQNRAATHSNTKMLLIHFRRRIWFIKNRRCKNIICPTKHSNKNPEFFTFSGQKKIEIEKKTKMQILEKSKKQTSPWYISVCFALVWLGFVCFPKIR